jgi:hypothetical protein
MTQVTASGAAPADPNAATPPAHVTVDDGGVARVDPSKRPEAAPPADPSRPAWLPDKFKTPEDFAKSYKEMETKLGGKGTPTQVTPEAAKVAVEQAGLDMKQLSKEISETGKLSDASVAALKAKGIDEATITTHVEGAKALASQFRASLAASVGGEDGLKNVTAWAKVNLTDADAAAFDQAVGSGNEALAKMALAAVHARYVASEGTDPKLVSGEGAVTDGVKPFGDTSQVTAAMRDPRYNTSETYRQEVRARLAVSKIFNQR